MFLYMVNIQLVVCNSFFVMLNTLEHLLNPHDLLLSEAQRVIISDILTPVA